MMLFGTLQRALWHRVNVQLQLYDETTDTFRGLIFKAWTKKDYHDLSKYTRSPLSPDELVEFSYFGHIELLS